MADRILAIASAGGHWVQLRRLRPAFEGLDVVFASVYSDYAHDVAPHRYYSFPDVTRLGKRKIFGLVFKVIYILLKERPKTVITTGAFPGYLALVKYFLARRRSGSTASPTAKGCLHRAATQSALRMSISRNGSILPGRKAPIIGAPSYDFRNCRLGASVRPFYAGC
jgi:hypothetical protein